VKPVVETLWGRQVTDSYRYMEALDPATLAWMKAQGAYTRAILDAIPARAALERRLKAAGSRTGAVQGYVSYGGRAFYEERAAGSDNLDLIVRDKGGRRVLVDVAALRAAHGGRPYAINYFLVSPDGTKAAVGVSEGGSEDASLFVYDTASGRPIGGPIDRAQLGATAWSNDSSVVYFSRLKSLKPTDAASERYRDGSLVSWDMKSEPRLLLGSVAGHGPPFQADEHPMLMILGSTIRGFRHGSPRS
jgi:prolyl oligopeptidase